MRIDEPYLILEDEGYQLADPPSVEDFERQLRQSLTSIAASRADAIIDRCPLDFVAYLQDIDDDVDIDGWMDELRTSIAQLDLIVLVSIEIPDRIAVARHEDRRWRQRVDQRLRSLVLDDPYGFDADTHEVHGTLDERIRQVMHLVSRSAGGTP
jgi:hypothetical protein